MFKRLISVFLCLASFLSVTACGPNADVPETTTATAPAFVAEPKELSPQETAVGLKPYVPSKPLTARPGLYVENGVVFHEGEEYYSIGINYYSAVGDFFLNPETGVDDCRRIFALLRDYGISYCRVNMGLFWPINIGKMHDDPQAYYAAMDALVQTAEEYEIGLICSFFWNLSGYSDYFDDPQSTWADGTSKTREFMRNYTELVTTRYQDSPAIWGWEFGNEINLKLDLLNSSDFYGPTDTTHLGSRPFRDETDDLFTDSMMAAMVEWAEIVCRCDPYDRMRSSGHAEPRPTQWHQYEYLKNSQTPFTLDNKTQMGEILTVEHPDPVNVVSIHSYEMQKRFRHSEPRVDCFTAFKEKAAAINKPLFIGEFAGLDSAMCKEIVDSIVALRVQLSCCWAIGNVEYSLDQDPAIREEVLGYIQQANAALSAQ